MIHLNNALRVQSRLHLLMLIAISTFIPVFHLQPRYFGPSPPPQHLHLIHIFQIMQQWILPLLYKLPFLFSMCSPAILWPLNSLRSSYNPELKYLLLLHSKQRSVRQRQVQPTMQDQAVTQFSDSSHSPLLRAKPLFVPFLFFSILINR